MIQNEKQYKISKNRVAEIEVAIKKAQATGKADTKRQAYINGLFHVSNTIKKEILDFEKIQKSGILPTRKISLFHLPDILIQYKISKRLSQKDFSAILGIKEQQLQRYEAEQYASVSFKRLLSFVEKTKLNITVAVGK